MVGLIIKDGEKDIPVVRRIEPKAYKVAAGTKPTQVFEPGPVNGATNLELSKY